MPALGRTVTLAAVEGLRTTLPPAQFRTEVLNQRAVNRHEAVIDAGAWASCADPGGTLDSARQRLAACVDVSPGGHVSLAVAAQGTDGIVRVEMAGGWESVAQARDELPELLGRIKARKVAYFSSSPAVELAEDIRRVVGDRLVKLTDPSEACASFTSLVAGRRIRHGAQALLDEHLAGASRMPKGNGWVFARTSVSGPVDAVYAAAGAVSLGRTMPAPSGAKLIVAA